MAESERIIKSDIADPNAVKEGFIDQWAEAIEFLDKTVAPALQKNAKLVKEAFGGLHIENLNDVKKANELVQQANQLLDAHSKIQKTKIELTNQQLAQSQIDKQNKRDEITLLKAQIIEMDKSVGTIQRLSAENAKLRVMVRGASADTKEGVANIAKWNAQINNNTTVIKANSDNLVRAKMNVGNYTESINKAFAGTGILGDTINKYLTVITLWAEKMEAAATTTASKTVATEAATAAEKTNIATLEAETVATETTAVATEGLGVALKALATNPYVIAIAAVAALSGVLYENITATQKNRNKIEEWIASAKAWAGTLFVAGVSSGAYSDAVKELTESLKEAEEQQISSIVTIQKNRTAAAQAREEANNENKSVKERIELIGEYIDKNKAATQIEIDIAKNISAAYIEFYENAKKSGKNLSNEQIKTINEAIAHAKALEEQQSAETNRGQKQRLNLINKFRDDTLKLRQDADKEEIEAINTHSDDKIKELQNELNKKLQLNEVERKIDIENLKKKQKELGVDKTEESRREIHDKNNKWDEKDKEGRQKNSDDIIKEKLAEFDMLAAITKKQNDERGKQQDKDFKTTTARFNELQSEELLSIAQAYDKKKIHTIKEEEEYQKAILEIKLKYLEIEKLRNADNEEELLNIQTEENNLRAAYLKLYADDEKKIAEERLKRIQKIEDDITKGIEDGLKTRSELLQQADQKDIDFHKRTIDIQKTLAAAGKANTLGEEEAAATKAEERKIQDAKKAARLQEDIALVKTFSDTLQKALDSGKPFGQALGEAAAAEGIVAAVFSKLFAGNFAEGVENFQGKGTGKSDSNIIGFSHGESVATASGTAQTPGLITAINKGGFKGVQDWAFEHIYKPQFNAANASTTQDKTISTVAYDPELLAEIKLLRTEIASKPVQMIQVKGLTEVLETVQRGNITSRTTHVPSRRNIRQNG